jgi:hypothetical protein
MPAWVSGLAGRLALVVIPGKDRTVLFPVHGSTVLGAERVQAPPPKELHLRFELPEDPPDDAPWLTEWLSAPKREGHFLLGGSPESLRDAALALLGDGPGKR